MLKPARRQMLEPIYDDSILTFNANGNLEYNPSFHPNNGKPFFTTELIYLCKYYAIDGVKAISLALGRTETSVMSAALRLKKDNKFDIYKNISDEQWLKLSGDS